MFRPSGQRTLSKSDDGDNGGDDNDPERIRRMLEQMKWRSTVEELLDEFVGRNRFKRPRLVVESEAVTEVDAATTAPITPTDDVVEVEDDPAPGDGHAGQPFPPLPPPAPDDAETDEPTTRHLL